MHTRRWRASLMIAKALTGKQRRAKRPLCQMGCHAHRAKFAIVSWFVMAF